MLRDKISIGFLPQSGQIALIAKHPVFLLRAIWKHLGYANAKTKRKIKSELRLIARIKTDTHQSPTSIN